MTVWQEIRKLNPVIHCITNPVSANFQANGLLAVGASPLMSDAGAELEELVPKVAALSLNIGTLNDTTFKLMLTAGKIANRHNIPIVLDPVGAGFTAYRTRLSRQLLTELKINLIRCNLGEFAALAQIPWQAKGVDAGSGDEQAVKKAAQNFINQYGCNLAVTGKEDLLITAAGTEIITGGHVLVTQITASGCLLSSLCAAAMAVSSDAKAGLAETLKLYKKAAAAAAANKASWGDFYRQFMNNLFAASQINPAAVKS